MKLLTLILITLSTTLSTYAAEKVQESEKKIQSGIYYGKILEIEDARGYKYLKIDENGTELWVAIASAPVSVGEKIGYDKTTIMHDFESKSLGKKFKEIIFASDVYLAQKAPKPTSMKDGLESTTNNPHANDPHKGTDMEQSPIEEEVKPTKPFVKKDFYTIEELHMYRKELKDQIISVKATVRKVSRQIMKLDWIHLSDGTGNEKNLSNDLVFTAASSTLNIGDKVIATGKVVTNKDFGYGYFYKVIIQDTTFKKE